MDITPEEARAELARRAGGKPESSFQEIGALKGKTTGQQIWQGLQVPEKMAKRGLTDLSKMMPNKVTGNLSGDIARNIPRIGLETAAQVAPSFVSRGSLLTQAALPMLGAMRPAASAIRKGIFSQAEDLALGGKSRDAVESAYKDSSLIFSKGPKSASPLYQEAMKEVPYEQTIFRGLGSNREIADKAIESTEKGIKLEPQESLIARKALDAVKKTMHPDAFSYYRGIFDEGAKSNDLISQADPLTRRGIQAQSLRQVFPKNAGGTTSPFKMTMAGALAGMGKTSLPVKILTKLASLSMSPLALGSAATAGGEGMRQFVDPLLSNPQLGAALPTVGRGISEILKKFRGNNANPDSQP